MFYRILITIMALFFVLLLVLINTGKQGISEKSGFVLPENHLWLENVSVIRVLDLYGDYLTITAKTAYFDHNSDLLLMTGAKFDMVKDNTRLTTYAEQGSYKLNDVLTVEGNISGVWNNLKYEVDKSGTFVYDFKTDQADVGDDITFTRNNSHIYAKNLHYDGKKNETLFSGGVEVIVTEEDLQ